MQYPAISQNFNSLFVYFSNNLQPLGTTLASFINDTLSKRVGIKQPPFTPFTATILVGCLTLTAVGALFYTVFGASKKPPASQPETNNPNENSQVDKFLEEIRPSEETAREILHSLDLTHQLIQRTTKNRFLSQKKIKDKGEKNELLSLATKDDVTLDVFTALAKAVNHMPARDFLYLLRAQTDLAKQKLGFILSHKKLSFITDAPSDVDLNFVLLMETPVQYIPSLPKFKVKVNKTNNGETILTKLASEAKRAGTEEHLPRIEALLRLRANPGIKNSESQDAVDLAPEKGPIREALEAAKNRKKTHSLSIL